MRIGLVHPDLGIGGAERLVVDAATGLTRLGHSVTIYTSYHNPLRSFQETNDGTITVELLGNSLFPRSINNRFFSVCAILRQLHLSLSLILSQNQNRNDVYFFDQLSASIPLIRYATRTRVLFYCHFPDLLLSNKQNSLLKSFYRIPLDYLEIYTTANADTILVNSQFTAQAFNRTMSCIKSNPKVVYPGVDINIYHNLSPNQINHKNILIQSHRPTIISINRFEQKKNINLILQAFILLRKNNTNIKPRLVLAGGYDDRLIDNKITLKALQDGIPSHLTQLTITTKDDLDQPPESSPDILFLLNLSHQHKLALLQASSTKLLGYTASNEHLGIGPLEAMACQLPVIAVDSGGPKETVCHNQTGFLVPPEPEKWADTINHILNMDDQERQTMGLAGRQRVIDLFSTDVMAKQFEDAIRDLLVPGKRLDLWLEPGFFRFLSCLFLPILAFFIALYKLT